MGVTKIFDFDGVILDSFPDQYNWFKHITNFLDKQFNYNNIEEFRNDYLEPVYPNMYTFLGFDWNKEKDIIWDEYIKHKTNRDIPLIGGIDEVIHKLGSNGDRMAIASSNIHEAIEQHLVKHNLSQYFDVIIGKDDLPTTNGDPMIKPNPSCILIALDKLGVEPSKAIYVGDSPCDIEAAKNVEKYLGEPIPMVAVSYGYASHEKLKISSNGNDVLRTPKELLEYLT